MRLPALIACLVILSWPARGEEQIAVARRGLNTDIRPIVRVGKPQVQVRVGASSTITLWKRGSIGTGSGPVYKFHNSGDYEIAPGEYEIACAGRVYGTGSTNCSLHYDDEFPRSAVAKPQHPPKGSGPRPLVQVNGRWGLSSGERLGECQCGDEAAFRAANQVNGGAGSSATRCAAGFASYLECQAQCMDGQVGGQLHCN